MKALARILLAVGLLLVIPSTPVNKQGDHTVEAKSDSRTDQPQTVQEPVKPLEPPEIPLSPKQELMEQAGIPRTEWSAVDFIFHRESTWRPDAVNKIGCIGLGQSCPVGSGLAKECPDWQTNQVCQIKHFDKYAKNRYGGWHQSVAAWKAQGWW